MFCFKTFLLELILSISVVSIYRWIDGVIDQLIDGQTNEQDQKDLFFYCILCSVTYHPVFVVLLLTENMRKKKVCEICCLLTVFIQLAF